MKPKRRRYLYESSEEDVRPLSRLLKALSDESRLRMVALLSHGDLCVCHLESALALSQWSVSRHLAILRAAGVVDGERRGTWVHYKLLPQEDPERRQIMRDLMAIFRDRSVFQRDAEQLLKTLGPDACK